MEIVRQRVGWTARKWTLDSLIDIGGMAAVYRATHRNGIQVAIKVLHPEFAANRDYRERFLREGYLANQVNHRNAVRVLDDDLLHDGTPFLVMDLLQGRSFATWLREKNVLESAEVLYVADRVLDVLAAAHERNIIHRDIKPGNVFLTNEGSVKVLDFGLARVLGASDVRKTRTGVVVGTTNYVSPEQASGKRDMVDHRTDIWAVGAMIFKALAGRPVHLGETQMDRLMAAASRPAPSLSDVAPHLPPGIASLVAHALAFDKQHRWPNAKSMQDALRHVYRDLEDMNIPVSRRVHDLAPWKSVVAGSVQTHGAAPLGSDPHVSVVFEDVEEGNSISVTVDHGEPTQQDD